MKLKEELINKFNIKVLAIKCDVTDEESVTKMVGYYL